MSLEIVSTSERFTARITRQFIGFLVAIVVVLGAGVWAINTYSAPVNAASTDHFITTWKTDNIGVSNESSITIPTFGGGYNYDVDWNNDGIFDEFGLTGAVTHDFGEPGTYTIRIQGDFPGILFSTGVTDSQKILSIDQWGTSPLGSFMGGAYNNAIHLAIVATDTPDLSNVTNMVSMFYGASGFTGDLSGWDVSNVTNMDSMFVGASVFTSDLSGWDVSNVTNMNSMFGDATLFDSDLSSWDVSNVTSMGYMFYGASSFNSDLSSWDISNVTDMSYMFADTTISSSNYDALLSSWSARLVQENVSFDAGEAKYCDATAARTFLIEEKGWTITDGGNCYDLYISGLAPEEIIADGANHVVTISGGNFAQGATVFFGDQEVTVQSLSSTEIEVLVPTVDIIETRTVDVTVVNPENESATLAEAFTYVYVDPGEITGVVFEVVEGRKIMTVTGSGMVLDISTLRLNGVNIPLRICSLGSGFTAIQFEEMFSNAPGSFSDTPLCLVLFEGGIPMQPDGTELKFWMPDTFDTNAPGTIELGSLLFTFNQPLDEGEDTEYSEPVVGNSGSVIPLGEASVIAKRPTFSGRTVPGSTVTVTVHSDPVVCTTIADGNGDWTCTLPSDLEAGVHSATVVIETPGGQMLTYGPYAVTVIGGESTVITNETPLAPNTGAKPVGASLWVFVVAVALLFGAVGFVALVVRRRLTD